MQHLFDLYGWEVNMYDTIQQGLINRTYSVQTTKGEFILQSINHNVFKNPKAIDANINAIGNYIKQTNPDYLYTHLIPSLQGNTLIEWEGGYYRAFNKIEGYALSVLDHKLQVEEAAKQFAKFTYVLKDFDANSLKDTLVQFHDLNFRYQQFSEAIQNGNAHRIEQSQQEIKILLSLKHYVDTYNNYIQHKDVKKRVTHHDTKISNVLFNMIDGQEQAICVIDLDTTMSGYYISDVGDMCRTCLCPVSEEEKDLNKIWVDGEKWQALQSGYLYYMKDELSNYEMDHFFFGGQFLIYMQALRFLTDHLNNDIYYGASYEGQNYQRTLNQIRLLEAYNQLG